MKKLLLTIAGVCAMAVGAKAQVSFTGTTYTQDFDSLANTGADVTFTDNSTITGWHAYSGDTAYSGSGAFTFTLGTANTAADAYDASDGSSGTGELYSFGTGTSTDRAFGAVGSGTPDDFFIGVEVQNNTGSSLSSYTVSYTGEQWRLGIAGQADQLLVFYRIGGTSFDATGTWTQVSALTFSSPITSGTVGALNGNTNSVNLSTTINDTVANGQSVWFAFVDPDNTGTDNGMALDNFSFATVPEPSTYMMLLGGALMMVLVIRRKQATI